MPDAWATSRRRAQPRARRYLDGYLRTVRLVDLLAVSLAVTVAQLLRFGFEERALQSQFGAVNYLSVSVVLVLAWMVSLQVLDAYDGRLVGHGVQEYRQTLRATTWLFAVVAIAALALKLDFARGYVLVAFPLGTVLLLLGRYGARRWLVTQRRRGRLSDRVLLVGDRDHVASLVVALGRTPDAGYNVLGACVDNAGSGQVAGVPVLGPESDVLVRAMELEVDVVAVSSSAGLGQTGLRRLGWALEGSDVDLVVAPGIMDVAGPRVLTRPVQGLPLIHVEAPDFAGPHLVAKNVLDRVMAVLMLLVLSPVLLAVAVAIRLEDGGPVLFRQQRVGREGRAFGMWKFRSMVCDAESQLPRLMSLNDATGPLFKLRADPRVTRTGAFIRKFSLDELPQLLNVLRGEMSLVGPRPPLPREVAEYEASTRRRLLVKPGMTGLWQISGRSDLSWDEAVRLDLYYVENWTPVLDVMILWRTAQVVLRPEHNGAY
ncbi:sugar transferase [Ornithinimicrobium pekingense]|uniref:Polyprenyl glycosylphosphotransferase n=1 Tax=Ornithinimicrobium pekingense TaxID=384677 RepID=A0ABQ2FCC4_9MICO|nr:sugar transferase [Ornithinimicrobium pekingense]GGK80585.1 polyprenyl glycosylphosphotransferase [Ornithinimicrobium pekingense]